MLPPTALIYNFPDAKIETVKYRTFAKKTVGNVKTPRIRAYEIYLQHGGGEDASGLDDWLRAEAEILATL